MSSQDVRKALRAVIDPEKAAFYPRFFKAGKGEYAEGDRFLGVVVPEQRKIAKRFRDLTLPQIRSLLKDRYHECRLTGLLILVLKFERASEEEREKIVAFYLEHLDYVNNWDLVDSSADKILGRWLLDKDRAVLYNLAEMDHLWRQRVSMIATYAMIKEGEFSDTIALAKKLRDHPHDLIHKAVGWMLREAGNRDMKTEEAFLKEHAEHMPRTMLRYAIEKFPEAKRKTYMNTKVN